LLIVDCKLIFAEFSPFLFLTHYSGSNLDGDDLNRALVVPFAERTIMGTDEMIEKRLTKIEADVERVVDRWRAVLKDPTSYRVLEGKPELSHFLGITGIVPVVAAKHFDDRAIDQAMKRKFVPLAVNGSRHFESTTIPWAAQGFKSFARICFRKF
jgi:hypothetical protein